MKKLSFILAQSKFDSWWVVASKNLHISQNIKDTSRDVSLFGIPLLVGNDVY